MFAVGCEVTANPGDPEVETHPGTGDADLLELLGGHRRQRARDHVSWHGVSSQPRCAGPISAPSGTTSSTGSPATLAWVRQASALGASSSQKECLPSAVRWLLIHCTPTSSPALTTFRATS